MMPNRLPVSVMTMTKLQPLCVRARGEGAADPLNRAKPFIWQSTNFSGSMQAATKNLKKRWMIYVVFRISLVQRDEVPKIRTFLTNY